MLCHHQLLDAMQWTKVWISKKWIWKSLADSQSTLNGKGYFYLTELVLLEDFSLPMRIENFWICFKVQIDNSIYVKKNLQFLTFDPEKKMCELWTFIVKFLYVSLKYCTVVGKQNIIWYFGDGNICPGIVKLCSWTTRSRIFKTLNFKPAIK